MHLTLSEDDARTLRQMLQDDLTALRREVARARPGEGREVNLDLKHRRDLCKRLIHDLDALPMM